jgi:hypothetical protein
MLKKLSKKSFLLIGAAMVLAAFVMPSMASAVVWEPLGSEHTLDSSNLSFVVGGALPAGSACAISQFTLDVRSTTTLTITSATFDNCTGTGANGTGCVTTAKATKLPWTATATSTDNIQIHGVHVDVSFASGNCTLVNNNVTLTGTLGGGTWDPLAHQVTFSADTGLTSHSALGSAPATVTGTIRDTQQTLTLS